MQLLTRGVIQHQQYANALASTARNRQRRRFADAVQRQQTLFNLGQRDTFLFDFHHPSLAANKAELTIIPDVQNIVEQNAVRLIDQR
ncbi:hypothetical protein D3C76_1468730 [compost metagenome]